MNCRQCWRKFVSKWYVWITVAAVTSQTFQVGNVISWTSTSIPKLTHLSKAAQGDLSNFFMYGIFVGAILTFFTLTYMARRTTLILNEVVLLSSWICLIFKNQITFLYIGRLLSGVAATSITLSMPVFLTECFHPKDRQISGGVMCLYSAAGMWIEYSIGPFVTYETMIAIAMIPIVLFLVTFPFYGVETPYYLVKKGRIEEARRVFSLFWSHDSEKSEIENELENVKETMKEEIELGLLGTLQSIFTEKGNLKACFLSTVLMMFFTATGYMQINMYMQPILIKAKVKQITPQISSAIIGNIKLGGALFAIPVIKFLGVKKTLVITLTGNALSLIALGGYFYSQSAGDNMNPVYWLPLTSVTMYYIFSLLGSASLPFILRGEILPRHLLGLGGSMSEVFGGATSVGVNHLFISLVDERIFLAFWIFAVIIFANVAFIIICIPETKGKTLYEIQEQIKGIDAFDVKG